MRLVAAEPVWVPVVAVPDRGDSLVSVCGAPGMSCALSRRRSFFGRSCRGLDPLKTTCPILSGVSAANFGPLQLGSNAPVLSPESLNLFRGELLCRILRLDFYLVLGKEPFQLLLLLRLGELAGLRLQGEYWLFVCLLGFLSPPFQLVGVFAPFPAVSAESGGVLLRRPTSRAQLLPAPS